MYELARKSNQAAQYAGHSGFPWRGSGVRGFNLKVEVFIGGIRLEVGTGEGDGDYGLGVKGRVKVKVQEMRRRRDEKGKERKKE